MPSLHDYGPEEFAIEFNVSRETLAHLEHYAALLAHWQNRINLVGSSTLPDLWWRHFRDSAQLLNDIPDTATHGIDLGSGAGFPGLVIAICARKPMRFELIEADQRKVSFLREAIRITNSKAELRAQRIETLVLRPPDFIVSRALAPLPRLFEYCEPFWGPDTLGLFLKGRRWEPEIDHCAQTWSFAYDRRPSITDSSAAILAVRSLRRV